MIDYLFPTEEQDNFYKELSVKDKESIKREYSKFKKSGNLTGCSELENIYGRANVLSKIDRLLEVLKHNVGKYVCMCCTCSEQQQSPANIRNLKNLGYVFEKNGRNYGKQIYCPNCGRKTTHYKLLLTEPDFNKNKERIAITQKTREKAYKHFGGRDAYTGAIITGDYDVDHKYSISACDPDEIVDINKLKEDEYDGEIQILTQEHNILKKSMCDKCLSTGIRPGFMGVNIWYKGDCNRKCCGRKGCIGCGWAHPDEWYKYVMTQCNKHLLCDKSNEDLIEMNSKLQVENEELKNKLNSIQKNKNNDCISDDSEQPLF